MKPNHPPQDWTRKRILYELEKAGWTAKRLAAHHQISYTTLMFALFRPFEKSERRIASAIGVEPRVIWPSRYDANGQRLSLPRTKQSPKQENTL